MSEAQPTGDLYQLRDWLAPEGGWLLVEEVTAMLGVTKQRVSVLVSEGKLNAKRHGTRLLIEEASVHARITSPPLRSTPPPVPAPDGWLDGYSGCRAPASG